MLRLVAGCVGEITLPYQPVLPQQTVDVGGGFPVVNQGPRGLTTLTLANEIYLQSDLSTPSSRFFEVGAESIPIGQLGTAQNFLFPEPATSNAQQSVNEFGDQRQNFKLPLTPQEGTSQSFYPSQPVCSTPTPTGIRNSYNVLLEEFRGISNRIIAIKINGLKFLLFLCFAAFQVTSIRSQEELKSEVRDLKRLLTQVLANVNREETTDCFNDLPLKEEEAFKVFNDNLKNKSAFDQLVCCIFCPSFWFSNLV